MLITVTCGQCQKAYSVDAKLGGKKVKCKSCGGIIAIPQDDAPAPSSTDLICNLAAAAVAEAMGTEVRRPQSAVATMTPPEAPPHASAAGYATDQLELPPALESPLPSSPEAASEDLGLTDPPCPRCRRPLPTGTRFCASCGFDRHPTPPAAVVTTRMPRGDPADEDRDHTGYRRNRPYEGGFLEWMDSAASLIGQGMFWFLVLACLVQSIRQVAEVARGRSNVPFFIYVLALLIWPMFLGIYVALIVPACYWGVRLACMIFKVNMPDEPRWRVISSHVISCSYFVVGWILALFFYWLLAPPDSFLTPLEAADRLIVVILPLGLLLAVPTHFFLTWLLMRLRFVETLVAWLFEVIALGVSLAVSFGLFILILMVMERLSR